jgi:hypothetical protein
METYPIDLDAEQIVRWVMAENRAVPSVFRITATRTTETREIPARQELRLGDEEREDLSEIATIGTLEIAPSDPQDGWRLKIVFEDEAGPRTLHRASVIGGEEEIDLATIYRDFVQRQRGTADVTASVDHPLGKSRLNRLLSKIETNRHGQAHAEG